MGMVFKANDNEKIVFDDYTDNTEDYDSYWVEICEDCLNKHKDILGNRVDDGGACGICSVKGCNNVADYYVDFDKNEVEFTDMEEWFGEVKWNKEDLVNALEVQCYPVTENNIKKLYDIVSNHWFTDYMIEMGWQYMYEQIGSGDGWEEQEAE